MNFSRREFLEAAVIAGTPFLAPTIAWGLLGTAPGSLSTLHPVDPPLRKQLLRIDQVMKTKGIHRDAITGRDYFSGYDYKTLYDWDQYFEGIVQLDLGWEPTYMMNGLKNFLDFQRPDGFIRRVNTPPPSEEAQEMFKPFLAQISVLIGRKLGNLEWLDDNDYERMRKFLLYWLNVLTKDGGVLSYWRSAPHTGMDTQHERAGHWKADYDNGVDLNSYLYRECLAFALIAKVKHRDADVMLFRQKAEAKKAAVQRMCWDDKSGFYYDVDNRTGRQIPVKSIAGFAPLWAGIASSEQAKRLVQEHLLNKQEFWRKFPVSSLAATEKGYTENYLPTDVHGSLWRATTWIPTNYYIFHGLLSYGYKDVATELANITFAMVSRIGDREYYTSDSATGCGRNPFWGWSLLAYFMPWENANHFDPTKLDLSEPMLHAL